MVSWWRSVSRKTMCGKTQVLIWDIPKRPHRERLCWCFKRASPHDYCLVSDVCPRQGPASAFPLGSPQTCSPYCINREKLEPSPFLSSSYSRPHLSIHRNPLPHLQLGSHLIPLLHYWFDFKISASHPTHCQFWILEEENKQTNNPCFAPLSITVLEKSPGTEDIKLICTCLSDCVQKR